MTSEVQQDGTTPELNELIKANILAIVDARHVSFPATVLVYDPVTQLCNVQPSVRIYETVEGVDVPLLIPPCLDCPVLFPTGGGYVIQWPLIAGDSVDVIVSSHDMDAWLTAGTPDTVPTSRRRGSLSDAKVWPGIRPKTNPRLSTSPGGMSMGLDSMVSEVRVQATEVVLTSPTVRLGSASATQFVALANLVLAELTNIVNKFNGHQHTETGATTGVPLIPMVAPSSVAATKVRGE